MIFNINSDTDKRILSRVVWLVENFIRNFSIFSSQSEKVTIVSDSFLNLNNERILNRVSTPSRATSDLFWSSLPWHEIKKALGGEINILDLGCGSGLYGNEIDLATNKELDFYHGIDPQEFKEWKTYSESNKKLSYSVAGADEIKETYNGQGLVISQSVLEHIPHDRQLIEDVGSLATSGNKRIIQIHLIPSSACFYKYLWHGYRQYTLKSIDELLKNISNSRAYVIPLGGKSCNKTHINWITLPEIKNRLLKRKNKNWEVDSKYIQDRNVAIQFDYSHLSRIDQASFYALIIDHNCNSDLIFDHLGLGAAKL